MKKLRNLLAFTLLVFSGYSFATCTLEGGSTVTQTVYPGTITVQRDVPVGTVFWSSTLPLSNQVIGGCTADSVTLYYSFVYNGAQSSGFTHYYKTPVPGVAMSVTVTGMSGGFLGYYDNPRYVDNFMGPYTIYTDTGTKVSLIKTGPITSGVMPSGQIGLWTADSGDTFMKLFMGNTTVNQVACSISTPSLTFPIGDILASRFGSTVGFIPTGVQNTQNLGLECDAGANINIMLQGTRNPDVSTTSVLALTGQGNADVAKGVGVQLLYNGTPLVLNNRLVLKRSSGGQETFPITARYYQTKATVSTGKADASATLDLTYQ